MIVQELLPFLLLGAVCGLDVVGFPQAMISRPIVAATVAGALGGHPGDGLLIGAVLELIAMETLPFGASRYPEWGSASVVGGALFAQHGSHTGGLPLAVFGALATAMASSWSMVVLRKLNARLMTGAGAEIEGGSAAAVMRVQIGGLVLDLLRGALVTLVLLVVLGPAFDAALDLWGASAVVSRSIVVGIAAAVAGGIIWNALPAGSRRVRAALIAGGVTAAVAVG